MTTTPGTSLAAAAPHTSATVASGSAVPVGLFGDGRSTTVGWTSLISATARPGSSPKSSSRLPVTHQVLVSRAYSGYMEYVGANETAVRPGPPDACRRGSMPALEPFAAQIGGGPARCPR